MIYQPEQKNKAPEATILALFLCATVTFISSSFEQIAGRGFLQGLALVFFCGMIFILVRYKFTKLRYIIRPGKRGYGTEEEEESVSADTQPKAADALRLPPEKLDFVVEREQGNRGYTAECMLSLGSLTACVPLPVHATDRRKAMKPYKSRRTFKFLKNMVGARQCLLVFQDDGGDIRVIIEASEKMEIYLSAVARYNKSDSFNA